MLENRSTLDTAAKIANLLALLPASYCAYGTYVLLHPPVSSAAKTTESHPEIASMVSVQGIIISLAIFLGCVGVGAILNMLAYQRKKKTESERQLAPKESAATQIVIPARRLKIIEAHYGVEGINDPDVTHYLLERLDGNAFAEPIGADLFHGFDPVSGKHKQLKVRYSFDGREATITRPEYAMLILPEDTFLNEQLEKCQRESKLKENQLNAELWRANEARRQCEEERRAAVAKVEESEAQATILSPLQRDALTLRKKMIEFLQEIGPEPVCDTSDCLNDPNLNAKRVSDWNREFGEFKTRLKSLYAVRLRQFAVEIYQRFVSAGIRDIHFGDLSNAPESVDDVRQLTVMLWRAAGEVGDPSGEEI